jgi:hypothetical protein
LSFLLLFFFFFFFFLPLAFEVLGCGCGLKRRRWNLASYEEEGKYRTRFDSHVWITYLEEGVGIVCWRPGYSSTSDQYSFFSFRSVCKKILSSGLPPALGFTFCLSFSNAPFSGRAYFHTSYLYILKHFETFPHICVKIRSPVWLSLFSHQVHMAGKRITESSNPLGTKHGFVSGFVSGLGSGL